MIKNTHAKVKNVETKQNKKTKNVRYEDIKIMRYEEKTHKKNKI